MKSLILLPERQDVIYHCQTLWQSELFKQSMAEGGYVCHLVERFAEQGRVFCQMSDGYMERAHFSAWWNVFPYREYGDAILNDLYWVHEMTHAILMPYGRGKTFEAWRQTMNENEYEASVESEAWIYTQLPGLRGLSFKHPIWVDRFLGEEGLSFPMTREDLYNRRLRAQTRPQDAIERAMSTFVEQNARWAEVWRLSYEDVEDVMCKFRDESTINRTQALKNHVRRLVERSEAQEAPYPWAREARAFAEIYWTKTQERATIVKVGL